MGYGWGNAANILEIIEGRCYCLVLSSSLVQCFEIGLPTVFYPSSGIARVVGLEAR